MSTLLPLATMFGVKWMYWWQIPLVIIVVALIVFLKMYKKKQM